MMLDALIQLATVSGGIFLVLGLWIAFQAFVRKGSGCSTDHDVLDYMAHSCGGCERGQTCQNRMKHAGLNPGDGASK